MKKTAKVSSPRQQRGFTLVEMSVTMAAAGLMFAAVTTGQELVDQAKASKLVNDVKSIEAQIQQFAQFKGRMPGDCNNDGVIDYAADANATQSLRSDIGNKARAEEYSYQGLQITIPADGVEASTQTDACSLTGSTAAANTTIADVATTSTNANVWLNDLKMAGVVSDSAPNRKLAKLVHEDFAFLGSVTDAGNESADGAEYNAIVIHNVPQWMARRLAVAINGQDARADRTRLRQLVRTTSTDGSYEQRWQALTTTATDTAAMRDANVTVVYFFDRIPESQIETGVIFNDT